MAASASISSNALNFISAVKSGVDPRTGLYSISINLPEIQGNDLRGPGFALALAYSPLNQRDSGYGYGWNLQLSQLALAYPETVTPSTGESLKVTNRQRLPDGRLRLLMEEQKIDSFHLYEETKANGNTQYRLVHKAGTVELLENYDGIALPKHIYAPSGHGLHLDYQSANSKQQLLDEVVDDTGAVLLRITRDSTSLVIAVYPGTGSPPLAEYKLTLGATDKRVTEIHLPGEDDNTWRFNYTTINDYLCVDSVETPLGGKEQILYDADGHEFPQAAHLPLPRVKQHDIDPGFDQPTITMTYTYRNDEGNPTNFLGYGSNVRWNDDGLDNLYQETEDYTYACVETLVVADEEVREVRRTFNRLHLLTDEMTTQGDNVQTVHTDYHLLDEEEFVDQPADCQLPQVIKTTWRNDRLNLSREENVTYTYDPHGNLLTKTLPSGIVETSEWYLAGGETGCPADPEGFVRQLKEKRTTPAPIGAEAPVVATQYQYVALQALPSSELGEWLTLERETVVQDPDNAKLELQRTVFTHNTTLDTPFLHGRPTSQATTLSGMTTQLDYFYEKVQDPDLSREVQQTTETLSTRFDDTSVKQLIRQHDLLTAVELKATVDNVETQYRYDSLGRKMSETVSPKTVNKATRQYRYEKHPYTSSAPGAAAQSQSVQLETDAKGVTSRTYLDGCGRVIARDRDKVSKQAPAAFFKTYTAKYDAWNELVSVTEFDYLADGQPKQLITTFKYDGWGQQYCAIGPDGVSSFNEIDPIGTRESAGPIQRTRVQGAGANPLIADRTETWLNLFGKPMRTSQLGADGLPYATQSFVYDGLGRCTAQADAMLNTTEFEYDAWSRLISTTLPGDVKVTQRYAPHSVAQLIEQLSVNANGKTTIVGTQTFDGLERLTSSTAGARTQHFAYEPGLAQVCTRTTAAGNSLSYTYNLQLTELPVTCTAAEEVTYFTYDPVSARLGEARNESGTRKYIFNVANQLTAERWSAGDGKTWETQHETSLQGRPLKRTDLRQLNGAGTAIEPGLDTVYTYTPANLRLAGISQGQLMSEFSYDPVGRLARLGTRDTGNGSTLVTVLTYDAHSREIERKLTLDQKPSRTLAQTWFKDGQLETRELMEGTVSLLKEAFVYDTRGRLVELTFSGTQLPVDSQGRRIAKQTFMFDALDNIQVSRRDFEPATVTPELTSFDYSAVDPCQLKSMSLAGSTVMFTFDQDGNQLNDAQGRTLVYDSQSRLVTVQAASGDVMSSYIYDGHDHLVNSTDGAAAPVLRFYQDEQLCNTVQDGIPLHLMYHEGQPLGQQSTAPADTLLLQTNANHSVLCESQRGILRDATFTAYGERNSDDPLASLVAFNGEVLEQDSGWYLLGRGYRAYNPALMRFHSPDTLSPFGTGGLNPYTYCLGNPIALRDPTGHASTGWGRAPRPEDYWDAPDKAPGGFAVWLNVAVGAVFVALGVVSFIGSYGTAAPASLALIGIGTGLGAASVAASAHAVATGSTDSEKAATYFGYASMAVAVPSIVGGVFRMATKKAVLEIGKRAVPFKNPLAFRNPLASVASSADDAASMKPFTAVARGRGPASSVASATREGAQQSAIAGSGRSLAQLRYTAQVKGVAKPMPGLSPSSQGVELNNSLRAASNATPSAAPTSGGLAQVVRDMGAGKVSTAFEFGTTVADLHGVLTRAQDIRQTQ
jgi:RHS repeat-associated protein